MSALYSIEVTFEDGRQRQWAYSAGGQTLYEERAGLMELPKALAWVREAGSRLGRFRARLRLATTSQKRWQAGRTDNAA